MNPKDIKLIRLSLIQPQGLFELYDEEDLENDGKLGRLQGLESYARLGSFGLDMHYSIAMNDVFFTLLGTICRSFPQRTNPNSGKFQSYNDPKMVAELGLFNYSHEQTIDVGRAMLAGSNAGPLEQGILRECIDKDPNARQMRARLGDYMVAIGTFAQELSNRSLFLGVRVEPEYRG